MKYLIVELRNRRNVKRNWRKFRKLVTKNTRYVYDDCNLRWMISICDTFVDHASGKRKSRALSISVFFAMLRFSEAVKYVSVDGIEPKNLEFKILYDGMTTFGIDKQDTFLNLSRRIYYILREDTFLLGLWQAMLQRVHENPSVVDKFASQSKLPGRYMPVNPLGIRDNYGYCYENLY